MLVPTLLIVGNTDTVLYELNRWALRRLNGEKHLVVIPGDAQAFEEKKALDTMCRVAMAVPYWSVFAFSTASSIAPIM